MNDLLRGNLLRCSFCGKSQNEVAKLIAGPKVYICVDCVTDAVAVLDREGITVFLERELPEAHVE